MDHDQPLHDDIASIRAELAELRHETARTQQQTQRTQWDVWFTIAGRGMAIAAPFVIAGGLASFGAMSDATRDTQQRVRLLEGTRFSAQDGAELRADLLETFAKQFPPTWLTASMERIEAATSKVADRIQRLEQRISALEGKLERARENR